MKEDLTYLLDFLKIQERSILNERKSLDEQLRELANERKIKVRQALVGLLPDLKNGTIRKIKKDVRGFHVPMVSKCFGLFEKIDPTVSLDSLRIKLGSYLDNMDEPPQFWVRIVGNTDQLISSLQTNLIAENNRRMEDVSARIAAIEKLINIDPSKLKPETREKMERAAKGQVKELRTGQGFASRDSRFRKKQGNHASRHHHNGIDGDDLLAAWLWYELLTPESESSAEISRLEPGRGEFGGAGASGDFSSSESNEQRTSVDSISSTIPEGVVASAVVVETIEQQYNLGAGSFS